MLGCDVIFVSSEVKLSCEKADALAGAGTAVVYLCSRKTDIRPCPRVLPEAGLHELGNKKWLKDARATIPSPLMSMVALSLLPVVAKFGLKRVVVQGLVSMSDKNRIGLDVLQDETQAFFSAPDLTCHPSAVLPRSIAFNVMPFEAEEDAAASFSTELAEILSLPKLKVDVSPVRVPVFVGHAASVVFETEKQATKEEMLECLSGEKWLHVDVEGGGFCSPRELHGQNRVRVTHLREASVFKGGMAFWVVADNLRRGVAESAVGLLGIFVRNGIIDALRAEKNAESQGS
jgi:aspartate-semialdehyde dehydrogenase